MQRYILKRLGQGVIVLIVVSLIVFALSRLSGDPLTLMLDPEATKADHEIMIKKLGLDKSLPEQYFLFITGALRGDFGESIWYTEPAITVVLEKVPATLELALTSILLSIIIAVPIGVLSAVKNNTMVDKAGKIFALIGQSAPIFWVGLVLMIVFAVNLRIFPTSGRGDIRHLILPAVTLGWYGNAFIMRITRSSMLDVLDSEYIKMARIAGISEWLVIWAHALKNAGISIANTIGLLVLAMIAGAVVTETVFAWPGVGRLVVDSIFHRDFPVVQTVVLLISSSVIVINLLVDLILAYLDPRIRFE
jgi:peptide/nickel transport system permease protein